MSQATGTPAAQPSLQQGLGALAVTIITLGRELGLHVVAEGVETPEQSAFLLRHGCNVQQGYFFSRPVPGDAFEQMLRDRCIVPEIARSTVAAV